MTPISLDLMGNDSTAFALLSLGFSLCVCVGSYKVLEMKELHKLLKCYTQIWDVIISRLWSQVILEQNFALNSREWGGIPLDNFEMHCEL